MNKLLRKPKRYLAVLLLCAAVLSVCSLLHGCAQESQQPSNVNDFSSISLTAEEPDFDESRYYVDASYVDDFVAARQERSQAAKGMSQEELEARAQEIMAGLTLEQKAGQLVLARCPEVHQIETIHAFHLGGYILYGKDFYEGSGTLIPEEEWEPLSKDQTKEKLGSFIAAATASSGVAPILAIDEEGGTVVRASTNSNLFPEGEIPSPQQIWQEEGDQALYDVTRAKTQTLVELGLNVNLAPVVDVVSEESAFMYARSMGADALKTAELVAGVVAATEEEGMGATLKHFPGYGNNTDTHNGLEVEDSRSLEQLQSTDFIPFKAGVEAGASAVMGSYLQVAAIDENAPVSFSPEATRILREDLGFSGVLITDDLWMAPADSVDGNLAPAAIAAGNDMVISTGFAKDHADILSAVQSGELDEDRFNEALTRVLLWKLRLGLL